MKRVYELNEKDIREAIAKSIGESQRVGVVAADVELKVRTDGGFGNTVIIATVTYEPRGASGG